MPTTHAPFSARISVSLHNDLIAEYPWRVVPMQELSTRRLRLLWCSSCGTETTYTPDCEWVWIILPGMKSELEV